VVLGRNQEEIEKRKSNKNNREKKTNDWLIGEIACWLSY
jgi:hypothetical protein